MGESGRDGSKCPGLLRRTCCTRSRISHSPALRGCLLRLWGSKSVPTQRSSRAGTGAKVRPGTCGLEDRASVQFATKARGCSRYQAQVSARSKSACGVAASYKPPMLVTRVRLPACAVFLPCAQSFFSSLQLCTRFSSRARLKSMKVRWLAIASNLRCGHLNGFVSQLVFHLSLLA